jgi:hypothetical protein
MTNYTASRGHSGPIPEENQPGHHPEHESDKPEGRPAPHIVDHRFSFRFDPPLGLLARGLGITPTSSFVHVVGDTLTIRFGAWTLQTTMSNIASAERTGPYRWWKVAGPPHLSLVDRGITFATTTSGGVCVRFREPVAAALPFGCLRHPSATVTVEEPDDLVTLLQR